MFTSSKVSAISRQQNFIQIVRVMKEEKETSFFAMNFESLQQQQNSFERIIGETSSTHL